MIRKIMTLKMILISLFLLRFITSNSQDCAPSMKSEDGKLEYFGGKIRDAIALVTDDKSAYSFYVVQVNKGKEGTVAFVSFYETVENRDIYNNALNDYLNNDKLKLSYIEIELGDKIIRIPSSSCTLQPKSTLGDITGYTVNFEGDILKSQVLLLQQYEIKKFKIVLGGKPYERTFNKSNKNTQIIKSAMDCVNVDNMFELQKKNPDEMDLSDVDQSDYSTVIIGKWLLQSDSGVVLEFIEDKIIVSKLGRVISEGTYKISGTRLIYTGTTTSGTSNNGVSNFELFLKDMIVLKDKGQELTYERVE